MNQKRPIPARTGQPRVGQIQGARRWAYPRSHGATPSTCMAVRSAKGLSPLARGNLAQDHQLLGEVGPIPARTGQPPQYRRHGPRDRAYPRSHGATATTTVVRLALTGLSPLARGNPLLPPLFPLRAGPIPARTGQPPPSCRTRRAEGAYPRSHGATFLRWRRCLCGGGLSPLARGNPRKPLPNRRARGPIPARTGQPAFACWNAMLWWAYPRSHGATALRFFLAGRAGGLSPLARGNQKLLGALAGLKGPIPARTGQPQSWRPRRPAKAAYPRSHGATFFSRAWQVERRGLSPLARGNLDAF